MIKSKWLVCSKCGKTDKTDKNYIGTKDIMGCPDCSNGKVNTYGRPVASMCRDCCPTGHRTKFSE
jgi:hypothetical protein